MIRGSLLLRTGMIRSAKGRIVIWYSRGENRAGGLDSLNHSTFISTLSDYRRMHYAATKLELMVRRIRKAGQQPRLLLTAKDEVSNFCGEKQETGWRRARKYD